MCNFFSCLITKPAKVLWDKNIDSHEKLIQKFELNDNQIRRTWCRVEVLPVKKSLTEALKKFNKKDWEVKIDEVLGFANDNQIDWWSEKHEKAAFSALKQCIKETVIYKKENIKIKEGRFFVINSTVEARENSTVQARENSTVQAWDNSTVEARDNSTVEAWDNSTVEAWENSTVLISQYSSFSLESLTLNMNSHCINHREEEVYYAENKYKYKKLEK